jgi:hypothetical protein
MRDKVGKLPEIKTAEQALKEIRRIALDKRAHVLMADECEWLELRLKTISKIAFRGLKL